MSGPVQITVDINIKDVLVETAQNTVLVISNKCSSQIEITQPVTKVIHILSSNRQLTSTCPNLRK